jgi:hypothetical protein
MEVGGGMKGSYFGIPPPATPSVWERGDHL